MTPNPSIHQLEKVSVFLSILGVISQSEREEIFTKIDHYKQQSKQVGCR
jgi:hypothetical protein